MLNFPRLNKLLFIVHIIFIKIDLKHNQHRWYAIANWHTITNVRRDKLIQRYKTRDFQEKEILRTLCTFHAFIRWGDLLKTLIWSLVNKWDSKWYIIQKFLNKYCLNGCFLWSTHLLSHSSTEDKQFQVPNLYPWLWSSSYLLQYVFPLL